MVPGMIERERLAADIRRLEWLADALLGLPLALAWPAVPSKARHSVPLGLSRCAVAMALVLSQRVRLMLPRSVWAPGEGATGPDMA